MSTVREHKKPGVTKRAKKNILQKVIILTVDPTLDEKYAKEPLSPKTEFWKKVFSNSSL